MRTAATAMHQTTRTPKAPVETPERPPLAPRQTALLDMLTRLAALRLQSPEGNRAVAIAVAAAGGGIGILLMLLLAESVHFAWGLVPFATSIVLVLGAPEAPQAQPRNIVGGHVLSALSGAFCCALFGHGIAAASLGVAGAIALMQSTRTFHPPAGINPVVMVIAHAGWSFVAFPVAVGAAILVAYAWIYHRLTQAAPWPRSWF